MQPVDTVVAFETPERVVFRHRIAGPAPRAMAWLVDAMIQTALFALLVGIALAAGVSLGGLGPGVAQAILMLGLFAMQWVYGAVVEGWWRGRTPGKALLGLRVVRSDGGPIGWPEAVLRNLVRGADALPGLYVVGLSTMAIDPRMRRLGDLVAGTMVVAQAGGQLLEAPAVIGPTASERATLPPHVRLLPEEKRLIASLIRRAPVLGEARVEELSRRPAGRISARTGVQGTSSWRTLQLAWIASGGPTIEARPRGREDGEAA